MSEPTPAPESVQEFLRGLKPFLTQFWNESDRAAVIVGLAQVEQSLTELIRAQLKPPRPSRGETLLSFDRPIGSLAAKIDLAERLGVVTSEAVDLLHAMRKIRNEFAHDIAGCSFAEGKVKDLAANVGNAYWRGAESIREHLLRSHQGGGSAASSEFRFILASVVFRLHAGQKLALPVELVWPPPPAVT
jgi:hypothetical protein